MKFAAWLLAVLLIGMTASGARAHRLAEDLWAYWPLVGDNFDASPQGLHGNSRGQLSQKVLGGPFTGATVFEGGWIEIPHPGDRDFRSFTISAWIKYDSAGTEFSPIIGRLGVVGRHRGLAYDVGEGGAPRLITMNITPQWQRWAHFALVHDAYDQTLSLWVNGWKTYEEKLPAGTIVPAPLGGDYGLGGKAGMAPTFRGEITDVIIFRRTLEPEEVMILSQGVGRMTPQQTGISQGCGGSGQPPCQVCLRYAAWPPAKWDECLPARRPWCAAYPDTNQLATCP